MVEVLRSTDTGRSIAPRLIASDLVAPDLIDLEVAAALRKNVLRGEATSAGAALVLRILSEWDIERVTHRELIVESIRWWPNATVYDAAYLALAAARGATLLTVDGPLARTPVQGLLVENVRVGPPA